jgi:putative CocE/NonD family hydrolase
MGPWTHLTGSSGDGLEDNGLPSLNQIALRWFDHWLKGIDTKIAQIPRVTQWTYGKEKYETQADWPDPRLRPTKRYLREGGELSTAAPKGDEAPDSFVQQPVSGVCTQSTSQWTAGATESIPCTTDNRLNEPTGVNFTTKPLEKDLPLNGPLAADLWLSTSASDAVVSVRVTDVSPDGASKELSGGWLSGSFRKLDRKKSRVVRGSVLQPWHPFTRASVLPVKAGEPMLLNVEVFPTNAVIKKGHSLRVSVNPSDFPHAVPPTPQLLDTLGGTVQILHDAKHASSVTLPTLGACGKCRALPLADFVR